jgi:hypothetical protein
MCASRILFSSTTAALLITPFFIDEEDFGIWLGTDDAQLLAAHSTVEVTRDAIHIPSITKNGHPLANELIEEFIRRAHEIGLTRHHQARGYWTLSETQELQVEAVIIASSDTPIEHTALTGLANWISEAGEQDAVAYEIGGVVKHWSG